MNDWKRTPPRAWAMAAAGFAVSCVLGCASNDVGDRNDSRLASAVDSAQEGDFVAAEATVVEVLKRDPRDAAAHYLYAMLLTRRGADDLARVGLRRVLALDPTHALALYNLGTLELSRGEPVAAAELLERATTLRPDHAPTLNNLGKAYYSIGLLELATAAFEHVLTLEPENDVARYNLDQIESALESMASRSSTAPTERS